MTSGTDDRQAQAERVRRIHRTAHWERDPNSAAYLADLTGGVRGHIVNVRPGQWEWWLSKQTGGAIMTQGVASDVHGAQRAAITAAITYVQIGYIP